MAYPSAFSFEELKNCRTYAAKKRYLENHLEKLGTGSSRIVFRVDDEKVIKLAKNPKGLAQNEEEISKGDWDVDIFAEVFDSDQDNFWIEMELARKPKKSDVKRIYGVPFSIIEDFMVKVYKQAGSDGYKYKFLGYENHNFENFWNDFWEWDDGNPTSHFKITDKLGYFLKSIYEYMANYGLYFPDFSDMRVLRNWGIVERNGEEEMVLIDMGLTEEIYNNFYRRK